MSNVKDIIKSGEYTMQLQKCLHQRPEHIASVYRYTPKIYKYVFANLTTFDRIPKHFNDIFFSIVKLGKEVDGSKYGRYALTVHGRGKKFGNTAEDCKYKAGCIIEFTSQHGIQIKDKKFNHVMFNAMLSTVKDVNARLGVS